MKANEKFEELKGFLLYHVRNNPERKLKDIIPLLNELFRNIEEPTNQLKEKKQ